MVVSEKQKEDVKGAGSEEHTIRKTRSESRGKQEEDEYQSMLTVRTIPEVSNQHAER